VTPPPAAATMRLVTALLVAALVPLAGCLGSADAEDPYAYMRKPLYASTFDLDSVGDGADFQEFRVTDGSIVEIRIQVWVNSTAGDATVRVINPSGHTVFESTQSGSRLVMVELGAWRVEVEGANQPAGAVGVLVTRN
jgi:hypothetical protein